MGWRGQGSQEAGLGQLPLPSTLTCLREHAGSHTVSKVQREWRENLVTRERRPPCCLAVPVPASQPPLKEMRAPVGFQAGSLAWPEVRAGGTGGEEVQVPSVGRRASDGQCWARYTCPSLSSTQHVCCVPAPLPSRGGCHCSLAHLPWLPWPRQPVSARQEPAAGIQLQAADELGGAHLTFLAGLVWHRVNQTSPISGQCSAGQGGGAYIPQNRKEAESPTAPGLAWEAP